MASDADLERARRALADDELVVYPTETVYGLGADARSSGAVGAVFEAKGRDRADPISFAVPDLDVAERYVSLSERERRFARAFLPGPVTLVTARREGRDPESGRVPRDSGGNGAGLLADELTGGRSRVGLRIPDHGRALALLEAVAPMPVTATSANVSGRPSPRTVEALDAGIRDAAAVVLDGGETPGGASTVVDVQEGRIIRPGREADAVERWLDDEG